jgi:hypothetical protein
MVAKNLLKNARPTTEWNLEKLLDRHQMAGPLPLDQIARAVQNGSRITAMANDWLREFFIVVS